MDINLFREIVSELGDQDLDDFSYTYENKIYGFNSVGDDNWTDEGKYQFREEKGQLVEFDDGYNVINSFNFGVSRSVSRTGSYYSDYYYENYPYEFYEIKEELVPEAIIPAHTEEKWKEIKF